MIDNYIFVHNPFYGFKTVRHAPLKAIQELESLKPSITRREKKSRVMCGILELAIELRINNRNTWLSHQ